MADIYNALNASPVIAVNTTYGPNWMRPTQILVGRFLKVGAQFDFSGPSGRGRSSRPVDIRPVRAIEGQAALNLACLFGRPERAARSTANVAVVIASSNWAGDGLGGGHRTSSAPGSVRSSSTARCASRSASSGRRTDAIGAWLLNTHPSAMSAGRRQSGRRRSASR